MSEQFWDNEAVVDERYATLAWGGDGTPAQVQPTIDAILRNLEAGIRECNGHSIMRVKEIGCGPGRILHRFARQRPDWLFTGTDISDRMLALGEADRPKNVEVTRARAPGSATYDMVYSVEVFQHLQAETKQCYLHWIAQELEPEGVAVIQYVHGFDWGLEANHPEHDANMQAWATRVGFEILDLDLAPIHDEWRWMVLRK